MLVKLFITKTAQTNEDLQLVAFPRYTCHTQAVERMVKLVTESSLAVCGATARDGFLKAKIESQKSMPKFETKKQFNVKVK